MKTQVFVLSLLLFFIFLSVNAGKKEIREPLFTELPNEWADSLLKQLTLEEKIGQLLMVAAYSNQGEEHTRELTSLIEKYHIGGLIFFQGGPKKQATLTNYYQSVSKIPLLIAIDAEWGLSMRLDSTIRYPRQMMLGALTDDELIYEMGKDIAEQCRRMGIHVNFAPVVDINNNPDNPVINSRSFGEDRYNVTMKGFAYTLGLQENGVIAVAKHFPGHGDTDADSHYSLPVIKHNKQHLDSIELYPFRQLVQNGLTGVMTTHLHIPDLDDEPNRAASLSPSIVKDILIDEMGFRGLIFTDALNMKGVSDYNKPGDLELKALLAGNDILLMPLDVPKAIARIKKEVRRGVIPEEEINKRCLKVLKAKYWAGLSEYEPVDTNQLIRDLNKQEYVLMQRRLIESALTLVENRDNLIPLRKLDEKRMASVSIGASTLTSFQQYLELYAHMDHFQISKDSPAETFNKLALELKDYDLVIIGLHGTDQRPQKRFGITQQSIVFIHKLANTTDIILDIFGNPYSLKYFSEIDNIKALLVSYEDTHFLQELSAQLIFGGISAQGKLPVSAGKKYPSGKGFYTETPIRFKYTIPEEAGLQSERLKKIDSIVWDAIQAKATPGCQVLVARNGKVVYHKAFGYHTYVKGQPVSIYDIYDLASITKIASTVPGIMELYENGELDVDRQLKDYLPELDTTNKGKLVIKDILTHQAQLNGWIPFYLKVMESIDPAYDLISNRFTPDYPFSLGGNMYLYKGVNYKKGVIQDNQTGVFSIQVASHLYINKSFPDSIFKTINLSELRSQNGYKYSDLGFYYFYKMIEKKYEQPMDSLLSESLYKPLGAYTTGYRPLNYYPLEKIVPTENDTYFRRQLLRGYVHDQGAAMLGGVCGHAGLFSNANDLAKIMQLYLNKGIYGGLRFFKPETIDLFTSAPFLEKGNRRGIGFDKPEPDTRQYGPTCRSASLESYGHTGFTGTMAWVDPAYNLIYIFLSNRIHPDMNNTKLIHMDVRTKIQQVIYDAIKN